MSWFRRSHSSRLALETLVPHERAFRRSLADEVAIDFPSSSAAIAYFRRDHVESGDPAEPCTFAEITVSQKQADTGTMAPLDLHVPRTCATCGGRGEVWNEPCEPCAGNGHELHHQRLTVSVPAGTEHGDRFSFNVSLPRGPRTRVDVRVVVTDPGA